jgi:hypothetical protein
MIQFRYLYDLIFNDTISLQKFDPIFSHLPKHFDLIKLKLELLLVYLDKYNRNCIYQKRLLF